MPPRRRFGHRRRKWLTSSPLRSWRSELINPATGGPPRRVGGATWKKVEVSAGMPKPPVGKIDVAIASSNSKRMWWWRDHDVIDLQADRQP